MSARVVVLGLLCLAGLLNSAYSQENPPRPENESIRSEIQKTEPEERSEASCHESCRAEGLDPEECRQECNWVASQPWPIPPQALCAR
jgi:hypothetical protein